ncbi:DUF6966 domain-containing protein [Cellulomonas palmilytica]|uniref:DUF6966 domain-containing protein n=1 Tax=Cellulomonas palmilytica TaxID=2608402 RepID=UPI001F2CDD87|nr:hypothetical protein [Cellulomonas palmilytica]
MDDDEADERYDRLVANLVAAADLLTRVGESYWAAWMTEAHRQITAQDAHGLEHLLRAYGGMGSFTEIASVLHHRHLPDDLDTCHAEAELSRLGSALHDDADALLRRFEHHR